MNIPIDTFVRRVCLAAGRTQVENGGTVYCRWYTERIFNGLIEIHASDISARVEAGGNQ